MNTRTLIALSSLGLACSPALAVNLIDARFGAGAGSFELGDFADPDGDGRMIVNGVSPATGWTYFGGATRLSWESSPTFAVSDGQRAANLLTVVGIQSFSGQFGVAIDNAGQVGDRYRVSFDAYGITNFFSPEVQITDGSVILGSFIATPNWRRYSLEFVPSTTTAAFGFRSPFGSGFGGATPYGPVIDNVVLENLSAVPEPGTVAALALGAAALAARRRRRA